MPEATGRLRRAVYLCLALLLVSFLFHVFGPGLSERLATCFRKAPSAAGAETEESEGFTGAVEDAVGFLLDLFEWDKAAWWGRLFQAVATGAFALALIIAAVVTHRLIGGGPPRTPPPPMEKLRNDEPWL